ncbi:hypothetical protein [Sphingobacterium faecale]|uniref:Uncharacterized protein n=1 Tax=Sphingobacterium faecale TaxID=2803775 RepID=A0ABS1R9R9_9SPHI|nr:hypothetical protein [Sphingobacterium faecale]MBL1411040.1 hypothetical protein [Sphingobacterium faecale]
MVYIFATSVQDDRDIQKLTPYLEEKLPDARWNFDLEDCDNIFRVDSPTSEADTIVKILLDVGYHCEELPYSL